MNNILIVQSINIFDNRIAVKYSVEGDWKIFFEEDSFFAEYNCNIRDCSESIAVIPFICNILPVAWVCDGKINVKCLDRDFYDNIQLIKNGYMKMYPHISFGGDIYAEKLEDNTITEKAPHNALFYSGGVDADYSFVKHIDTVYALISVWGADIAFDDLKGWERLKKQALELSEQYNLKPLFIKSNFRTFLNESALSELIHDKSGDFWWHGFQHGIGLIGLAAPLVPEHSLETLYIAATFTSKDAGKVTCASDPSIDNNVHIAGCKTIHDGYEANRQMKIKQICKYKRDNPEIKMDIRVCWVTKGGINCCKCEKCVRTICGIMVEGENPRNYGFHYTKMDNLLMPLRVKYKFKIDYILKPLWIDIQNRFYENKGKLANDSGIKWLGRIDFNHIDNNAIRRAKRLYHKIRGI